MSDLNLEHEPIDRDDIKAKFEDLMGGLGQTTEAARTPMLGGGIVVLVMLVAVAFWLGRRRGRASRTVVEVRRV